MNRRLVSWGALAAVLTVCLMAYGQRQEQQGRGRGVGGGANVAMLLRAEAVRQELKVTDEQVAKLRELMPADRQGLGNLRDMSPEQRRQAMAERRSAAEEREKKMNEILNPAQRQRLMEILVQASGLRAVTVEAVAEKLGVTEEQKGKLQEALREMSQARRGAAGGTPDREAFTRMREQYEAKIKEVLTEAQVAQLEELKGKPFDMSLLRAGGRGGRGPRTD